MRQLTWRSTPSRPVTAAQIMPNVPPTAKQIALSSSGGAGAVATVNSAKSAQSRMAIKPVKVALREVIIAAG